EGREIRPRSRHCNRPVLRIAIAHWFRFCERAGKGRSGNKKRSRTRSAFVSEIPREEFSRGFGKAESQETCPRLFLPEPFAREGADGSPIFSRGFFYWSASFAAKISRAKNNAARVCSDSDASRRSA